MSKSIELGEAIPVGRHSGIATIKHISLQNSKLFIRFQKTFLPKIIEKRMILKYWLEIMAHCFIKNLHKRNHTIAKMHRNGPENDASICVKLLYCLVKKYRIYLKLIIFT